MFISRFLALSLFSRMLVATLCVLNASPVYSGPLSDLLCGIRSFLPANRSANAGAVPSAGNWQRLGAQTLAGEFHTGSTNLIEQAPFVVEALRAKLPIVERELRAQERSGIGAIAATESLPLSVRQQIFRVLREQVESATSMTFKDYFLYNLRLAFVVDHIVAIDFYLAGFVHFISFVRQQRDGSYLMNNEQFERALMGYYESSSSYWKEIMLLKLIIDPPAGFASLSAVSLFSFRGMASRQSTFLNRSLGFEREIELLLDPSERLQGLSRETYLNAKGLGKYADGDFYSVPVLMFHDLLHHLQVLVSMIDGWKNVSTLERFASQNRPAILLGMNRLMSVYRNIESLRERAQDLNLPQVERDVLDKVLFAILHELDRGRSLLSRADFEVRMLGANEPLWRENFRAGRLAEFIHFKFFVQTFGRDFLAQPGAMQVAQVVAALRFIYDNSDLLRP